MTRVCVYEYGLLQPTEGKELVTDQMSRGHRYYNELVAFAREQRAAYRAALLQVGDLEARTRELDALIAARAAAREAVNTARQRLSSPVDVGPLRAEARRLGEAIAVASAARKALREEIKRSPAIAAFVAQQKAERSTRTRALRAASGLAWGTYQALEEAWKRACQTATVDPRFRRWTGDGMVAVHVQGSPLPATALFDGTSSQAQIDPVPARAFDTTVPQGERRRLRRTVLRLRVASTPDKKPVWASWPMILHRPLPEGASVLWVKVYREKRTRWCRWRAQVTVAVEAPRPSQLDAAVGMDLGWRRFPDDSVRVAYWYDTLGREGELRLDPSILRRWEKADAIHGVRATNLDALRARLVAVLRAHPLPAGELADLVSTLHLWRSPARFAALYKRHADALPPEAAADLQNWCYRDLHLWEYETGLRRAAIGHRREMMRRFAAELVRRVGTVYVEDFDLREAGKRPEAEDKPAVASGEAAVADATRRQRVIASPGVLRELLGATAAKHGVGIVRVDRAGTTTTCYACKDDRPWNDPIALHHVCEACGLRVDRDAQAARNILARGAVVPETPGSLAGDQNKDAGGVAPIGRVGGVHQPEARAAALASGAE